MGERKISMSINYRERNFVYKKSYWILRLHEYISVSWYFKNKMGPSSVHVCKCEAAAYGGRGEIWGNGGLSGFLVLYPSVFNIPLLSLKEIRRGIWPNHHKCSSHFRDYEKSDWIISWSFGEKWKLVYPENCNKAQCGINVECKIELRIVQPTVSRKRIHS